MDWNEEEVEACCEAFRGVDLDGESEISITEVRAIMNRAVELVVARGGTMTPEDILEDLENGERYDRLQQHISAQGARVAVLEAEKVKWEAELSSVHDAREKAKQSEAVWRKRLEAAAEELADVAPGECGRLDIVTRVRMLKLLLEAKSKELVDVQIGPTSSTGWCCTAGAVTAGSTHNGGCVRRHPCSPTCTHDDASTPGHAERVKERSEAFRETCDHEDSTVYHCGAEAMRAACWEAAQVRMRILGMTEEDMVWQEIKAAIEGAAP